MIIYKLMDSGKADSWGYLPDSQKVPSGFLSIPGDRIPDSIAQYHTQEYLDLLKLNNQEQTCIKLLNDSEKAVSQDPPYPEDVDEWKILRQQWRDIIKNNVLVEEIPKPTFIPE